MPKTQWQFSATIHHTEQKILAFENPKFKISAEFTILGLENPEFKIFADFTILALQNP